MDKTNNRKFNKTALRRAGMLAIGYVKNKAVAVAVIAVVTIAVMALFTGADISDYQAYDFNNCPMCAAKQKIDAIVNSYGYSKL